MKNQAHPMEISHYRFKEVELEFIDLGPITGVYKEHNPLALKKDLHEYGDLEYCKFKIKDKDKVISPPSGVYCFSLNRTLPVYIGKCDNYKNIINGSYGHITAPKCYREGGTQTFCRLNNKIYQNKKNKGEVSFWILCGWDGSDNGNPPPSKQKVKAAYGRDPSWNL